MKFAKLTFLIAGGYGLLALAPLYFMEQQTGRDYPPPITHPEYYYGFIGVAVAWQLAFIVMSRDPVRYRALMPVAVVEKASFFIPRFCFTSNTACRPSCSQQEPSTAF